MEKVDDFIRELQMLSDKHRVAILFDVDGVVLDTQWNVKYDSFEWQDELWLDVDPLHKRETKA